MRIDKIIFSLFGLLWALSAIQGQDLAGYKNQLNQFETQETIQNVFVDFDQEYYLAGTELKFNLFLVNQDRKMIPSHDVVHIRLLSDKGKVLQTMKLVTDEGRAAGTLQLEEEWPSGKYNFFAFTRLMANYDQSYYFRHAIPVINPKDYDGSIGTDTDIDQADDWVDIVEKESFVSFQVDSIPEWMNTNFIIQQNTNIAFEARVTYLPFTIDVPKTVLKGDLNFLVGLWKGADYIRNTFFQLGGNETDVAITFPTSNSPRSAQNLELQVMENGQPVNATLAVQLTKESKNKRIRNHVLRSFNFSNQAEPSYSSWRYSVAALNSSDQPEGYTAIKDEPYDILIENDTVVIENITLRLPVDKQTGEIKLLLDSSIRESVRKRVEGKTVVGNSGTTYQQEFNSVTVEGVIKNVMGEPASNRSFNFYFVNQMFAYSEETDENGFVSFQSEPFYGNDYMVISPIVKQAGERFTFETFDFEKNLDFDEGTGNGTDDFRQLKEKQENQRIEEAYRDESSLTYIGGSELSLYDEYRRFYFKSIILDEYIAFSTMEEVINEIVIACRVIGKEKDIRLVFENRGINFPGPPGFLVNGVPVIEEDSILAMDPAKIESIGVINTAKDLREFYNFGSNGVLVFKTVNNQPLVKTLDSNVVLVQGLDPARREPDWSSKAANLPDFRKTLLWAPVVNISAESPGTLNYETSDELGEYTLYIQGFTESGKVIDVEYKMEVNR